MDNSKRNAALLVAMGLVLVVSAAWGDPGAPFMVAEGDLTGLRKKTTTTFTVEEVDVKATIRGFAAENEVTITFRNPTRRNLSGDFVFPLPVGSTVSGYAIDVSGRMLEGVVIDPERGRTIYESFMRRNVDPGLVEWVDGNVFRSRVFPIFAGKTRTVRLKYLTELESDGSALTYTMGLDYPGKIKRFSLRIEVSGAGSEPITDEGWDDATVVPKDDDYVLEVTRKDVELKKAFSFFMPGAWQQGVMVEETPDGERFFCVTDFPPVFNKQEGVNAGHVAVLWDVSGSRDKKALARELALLKAYVQKEKNAPDKIDLIAFSTIASHVGTFTVENGDCEPLWEAIEALQYDGGTWLGCLDSMPISSSPGAYMLFTDGHFTFGRESLAVSDRPIYVISGAKKANRRLLSALASASGGEFHDLTANSTDETASQIGMAGFSFLGIEAPEGGSHAMYPSMPCPVGMQMTVVGKLKAETDTVTLRYGIHGKQTYEVKYVIRASEARTGTILKRLWAQKKLEELQLHPRRNTDKIIELGRYAHMVTPGTSLLVLESVADYIRWDLEPPASEPKWVAAFKEQRPIAAVARRTRDDSIPAETIADWEDHVASLTAEDDKTIAYHVYINKTRKQEVASGPVLNTSSDSSDRTAMASGPALNSSSRQAQLQSAMLSSSGNRGPRVSRTRRHPDSSSHPDSTVWTPSFAGVAAPAADASRATIRELFVTDAEKGYLNTLKHTPRKRLWEVYLKLRKEHKGKPAFFVTCADYFFTRKEFGLAVQVLSNIPEIDPGNVELLRMTAHAFGRHGMRGAGLELLEHVMRISPDEPQSYRDLAMALAGYARDLGTAPARKQKKSQAGPVPLSLDGPYPDQVTDTAQRAALRKKAYTRAFSMLKTVAYRQWEDREGISTIALTELNHMATEARKAGAKNIDIDSRLEALIGYDVRMVLTWDRGTVPLSLSIKDPSGTTTDQKNRTTRNGARMSSPCRSGYGPEEYLVRKGTRGKYKIMLEITDRAALTRAGCVNARIDVFSDYDRRTERTRSFAVRLDPRSPDTVHVVTLKL